MKTCTKCETVKDLTEFHKGKGYKDGYRSECKVCISAYYKARNATTQQKEKNRAWSYQRKYGITPVQYDEMLAAQGGGCSICKSPESKRSGQRLMVDHDHKTGEVRGLLCNPCNAAIGLLGDNISTLQNAINYLSAN